MSDKLNVIPSLIHISCGTLHIWSARSQMTVSCSNNTKASTPAATVPFVITYNDFIQGPNKRITKCNICGIKIKDAGSTTSNFFKHLKTHPGQSLGNVKVKVSACGWLANV